MKKLLALALALVMCLALAACGTSGAPAAGSGSAAPAAGSGSAAADTKDDKAAANKDDVKIGCILIGDENEGYSYAHIKGIEEAVEATGLSMDNVIMKYSVPENSACYDAAIDLVEQGCSRVISNSYSHQSYMQQAAQECPDVTFVACTGDTANQAGLSNFKNAFTGIYQARYVSGVVAGMKIAELVNDGKLTDKNYSDGKVKVGYVGAYPYAEVVSGYTAFFLGIQSVYPDVTMEVQYTNSWYDPVAEGEAANALMARGCVIIGQHADSTGAPSAVQAQKDAGSVVYSVGYNIDMLEVAPTAALTSSQNNWSVLYRDTLEKFIAGEEVPVDYAVGISEDAVMISKLGPECAEGTQEAVDAAWSSIKDGSLKVFDTSKFTCQPAADGSYQVDADGHVTSAFGLDSDGDFVNDTGEAIVDGAFQESVLRSAPYFSLRIDGITELNNN